jgi:hypothetical protein
LERPNPSALGDLDGLDTNASDGKVLAGRSNAIHLDVQGVGVAIAISRRPLVAHWELWCGRKLGDSDC